MKLPNQKNAFVSLSKISEYLVSETHPVGKWKAKIFRSHGYNEKNIDSLRDGLLSIANKEEVKDIINSGYGIKYIIDGTLKTPNGKELTVKTVWIIDAGREIPRFVTAYPA